MILEDTLAARPRQENYFPPAKLRTFEGSGQRKLPLQNRVDIRPKWRNAKRTKPTFEGKLHERNNS